MGFYSVFTFHARINLKNILTVIGGLPSEAGKTPAPLEN
jgi:hypothetical protein